MTDDCLSTACCDFCWFFDFHGDEDGFYVNEGRCEHPDHRKPMDPGGYCKDFRCEVCDGAPVDLS